ncbi:hypothetical protein ACH5RR_018030 [Cinchona calisaya]|uniref:Uncharacterized protein n=1 Tax=Cinchona calisaya TaxID=153742 RepID=A0ABD2ZK87_9GENT
MFYDKLALIASPCLEIGIDFYGPKDDKINTLTTPGEVYRAFLSEISNRTWSIFVREDATVGNDTIVREFIANTHKLTCTVVQVRKRSVNFSREVINSYYQISNIEESEYAIFKHSDINYDVLLWELCDPHVPDDILAHQLHPAQPLDLANWLLEPDAPSWHFGPLANDEYGPGSEKSEDKYADHAADDEVGPSGRS